MNDKLKKVLNFIRGLFPSRLPQGLTEFNAWAQSIMDTYALPTLEVDSIRYILATVVMQLGAQTAYKSKMYFVLTLKAAAAKQVAGSVFYDIKTKQQEQQVKAQQAAATALSVVASEPKEQGIC